jgi:hypothetical protein
VFLSVSFSHKRSEEETVNQGLVLTFIIISMQKLLFVAFDKFVFTVHGFPEGAEGFSAKDNYQKSLIVT